MVQSKPVSGGAADTEVCVPDTHPTFIRNRPTIRACSLLLPRTRGKHVSFSIKTQSHLVKFASLNKRCLDKVLCSLL